MASLPASPAPPTAVAATSALGETLLRCALPTTVTLVRGEPVTPPAGGASQSPSLADDAAAQLSQLEHALGGMSVRGSAEVEIGGSSPSPGRSRRASRTPNRSRNDDEYNLALATPPTPPRAHMDNSPLKGGDQAAGDSTAIDAILDRVSSGEVAGWEFAASLSSRARVDIHKRAEARGMEHESLGVQPRRHLYLNKPDDEDQRKRRQFSLGFEAPRTRRMELTSDVLRVLVCLAVAVYIVCRMGHLYLEGSALDELGREASPHVDAASQACRVARDGTHYHITLMHSTHLDQIRTLRPTCLNHCESAVEPSSSSSSIAAASQVPAPPASLLSTRALEAELVELFSSRLNTPLTDRGLGRVTQSPHTAYFRVIDWPQANALRQELGLPPTDFHVTVGFHKQDVHGVPKDASTLFA